MRRPRLVRSLGVPVCAFVSALATLSCTPAPPPAAGAEDDTSAPAPSTDGADGAADSSDGADGTADGDDGGGDGSDDTAGESDGPWSLPERPDTDAPSADASWRHGGGAGYPDRVDPTWPVVTRVGTADALVDAVQAALPGDIVFVEGDARIDLTDRHPCIPEGVWLASDRGDGDAPGALLYTTETERDGFIDICGDNVRITGLRILGADPEQCPDAWPDACTGDIEGDTNCRDCTPASIGIQSVGHDRVEVDNTELAGWSYAATWFTDGVDHHVHHNHIHHTWRQGLGYGVVLTGSTPVEVTIAWNRFNANRHAVAGSGYPTQSYEARDNLVLETANGHIFDMHGQDERERDGSEWAGDDLRIHRNIVLAPDYYALVVRGAPATGSWLYDNCLARSSADAAARQSRYTGRFHVDEDPSGAAAPNTYGAAAADCAPLRWCVAEPDQGTWRWHRQSAEAIGDVGVGDFDGDGVDDLFSADGAAWRISAGAAADWTTLNTSSYVLSQLTLVDVDGDGRTDVLRSGSGGWFVSLGGQARWSQWSTHAGSPASVLWGDLNGDGASDAFRTSAGSWQVSWGGADAWQTLQDDATPQSELALADLDGDGIDDVFHATGSAWRMSPGGTGAWQDVGTSSYTAITLLDADGDGIADVVRGSGVSWWVSWSGRSRWTRLRIGRESLSEVIWGDFDGDGRTEALRSNCQ